MTIRVWLTTGEEIECIEVNDSHRMWRLISKRCKQWNARVIKVKKTVLTSL